MAPVSEVVFKKKLEILLQARGELPGHDANSKNLDGPQKTQKRTTHPSYYGSPAWCFFDSRRFLTIEENLAYMELRYSFRLPFPERLKDRDGLVRHLGKKIFEKHTCIFCHKRFRSLIAVRGHMVDLGHTGVDTSRDFLSLERFYDLQKFMGAPNSRPPAPDETIGLTTNEHAGDDNESSWSDMSDEDSERNHVGSRYGLDYALGSHRINELGNLILPDGREAAHRDVAYVYRQRVTRPSLVQPAMRLALAHAKELRALTEKGGGFETAALRRVRVARSGAMQNKLREASYADFAVRLGVKNNLLNRSVKRAEKCFV